MRLLIFASLLLLLVLTTVNHTAQVLGQESDDQSKHGWHVVNVTFHNICSEIAIVSYTNGDGSSVVQGVEPFRDFDSYKGLRIFNNDSEEQGFKLSLKTRVFSGKTIPLIETVYNAQGELSVIVLKYKPGYVYQSPMDLVVFYSGFQKNSTLEISYQGLENPEKICLAPGESSKELYYNTEYPVVGNYFLLDEHGQRSNDPVQARQKRVGNKIIFLPLKKR